MSLAELRVAEVHALAELRDGMLEVRGELVIRQPRRLSDHANHPDPMLELDRAAMRVHGASGIGLWDEVHGLALNRDRVTVLLPVAGENDPGPDTRLVEAAREARVKLVCAGLEVTGFITVPVNLTLPGFVHESRRRFLAVTRARVILARGVAVDGLDRVLTFCLVNRHHVIASTDTGSQPG